MAFRVGFRKTLFKLGKWRFGIGYSTHGATGIIMLCVFGLPNLMWYMILGCLWLGYYLVLGIGWLYYAMFVLPVKAIFRLIKNKKSESNSNHEV